MDAILSELQLFPCKGLYMCDMIEYMTHWDINILTLFA